MASQIHLYQPQGRLAAVGLTALLLTCSLVAGRAKAAQVSLSEIPLFLGTSAPANIMLLIDDSGSMDWNTITPENSGVFHMQCDAGDPGDGNGFRQFVDTRNLGYTHEVGDEIFGTNSGNGGRIPTDALANNQAANRFVTDNQGFWRAWNSDYNNLYYDPTVRYLPWAGSDNGGTPFGNANPTSVRIDPNNTSTSSSNRFNLTVNDTYSVRFECQGTNNANLTLYPARYFTWTDSDNDGVVDPLDGHQLIEIRPSGDSACTPTDGVDTAQCPAEFTNRPATRTDCAQIAGGTGTTCTRTEELQNFANWFQYYRRRELTTKSAFSQLVQNITGVRMGLATINKNDDTPGDGGNTVQTAIRSLNIGGNRTTLLDRVVSVRSTGGTPLLNGLNDCGLYLNCGTGTDDATDANSSFNDHQNPFGFRHDGTRDDIDPEAGDGSDTLGAGCPALKASKGGACQQNFLIAMTDGYYNTSNPNVGEYDMDGSAPDTPFDGGAYASSIANTAADITMRFYKQDIQPSLANNVPSQPGIDEANHQHMVTYTVGFGLIGTLTPGAGGLDQNGFPIDRASPFPWPNPGNLNDDNPEKLDDLLHAAFNGRGLFLSARRPQELIDKLQDIVEDIANRTSSASSVALNSGSLNTGTRIFQARFDSADWTGQLLAFPVSSGVPNQANGCTSEALGFLCQQAWNASTVLNGQNWDSGRKIITSNTSTRAGIPFRWANLTTAQKDHLCDDPNTSTVETCNTTARTNAGIARLEFLRGSRANENPAGLQFRARQTVLGDLVNSDPFFVGPPNGPYDILPTIGPAYATFRSTYSGRDPMVMVGANDGMLHVFNAQTGTEMLAYVPSDNYIYADLDRLTHNNYAAAHRFFVDGSPTSGDAYFDTDGNGSNEWATVAVGSLRAGGQGIFALNLTNPALFSEGNADNILLWEFNHTDDRDLGFTYSRPSIVQMQNGKWAVLIGNGYNNSCFNNATLCGSDGTTNTNASSTGKAYLFILYLDGPGSDNVWNPGTDYIKIEVNAGSTATPNGLASPSGIDVNDDFKVDYIYAGDLEGNMWRFNTTSTTPGSWIVGKGGNPIFRACSGSPCSDANRQPITTKPEVGLHPTGSPVSLPDDLPPFTVTNGVLVYFGTGRYIASTDKNPGDGQNQAGTANQTQTFYGVWDTLDDTTTVYTPANLTQQTIDFEVNESGGNCTVANPNCFRFTSNHPVYIDTAPANGPGDPGLDRPAGTRGWYLNLINTNTLQNPGQSNFGERQVSDSILRSNRLLFTTLLPNPNQCEFGGGGWLMELNPFTGARLPFQPFDVDNDGVIDSDDVITITLPDGTTQQVPAGGVRSTVGIIPRPTILDIAGPTELKYMSGSLGSIQKVLNKEGGKSGRLTWRQLK